jgi:hypothetical protein
MAANHPDRIASLSLICPFGLNTDVLRTLASRLLVITSDRGPDGERIRRLLNDLPGAVSATIRDYESFMCRM